MSLRLRRGTDVERQSVVFAEGELVYTTDLKEIYIGDGVTLGGIKVTSAVDETPIALTRDLDLNSFDIVGSGDIDINGVVTANVFYGSGAQLTDLPLLNVNNGAAYQISIVGADSTTIVNSDTSELYGSFFGNLSGNLTGSIYDAENGVIVDNIAKTFNGTFYGDGSNLTNLVLPDGSEHKINIIGFDSTVMVDSITSMFYGDGSNLTNLVLPDGSEHRINIIGADSTVMVDAASSSFTGTLTGDIYGIDDLIIIDSVNSNISANTMNLKSDISIVPDPEVIGPNYVNISSNDDRSIIKLIRVSDVDITNDQVLYGSIFFQRTDVTGDTATSIIMGGRDGIFVSADYANSFPEASTLSVATNGNVGIGAYTPTEKLVVEGNAKISGFVQFGSFTTEQRDAITAVNGMVIYNITNNKFEGYQNSSWINLDNGNAAS